MRTGWAGRATRVESGLLFARGNQVVYRRGGLIEWYRNGPAGLEQGFILSRPDRPLGRWVKVSERLSGDISWHRDGAALVGREGRGRIAFRYGGLSAVDARGRPLPVRLGLDGATVRLSVDQTHAAYPVTIDPMLEQGTKLTASDAVGGALFGESVAVSGDGETAVIGGPGDDAAWVFTRSGTTWAQGPKLTPDDAIGHAAFGDSVAISGDGNTILVGGPGDGSWIGAAWVFIRSGSGWSQQGPKLIPNDIVPPRGSQAVGVGGAVALSDDGNTALVGAGAYQSGMGAAWVFSRAGTSWSQQGPKLLPNDGGGRPRFGASLALSAGGDTALIGGPGDRGFLGAAWVFTRSGASWAQQGRKLTPHDSVGAAQFGWAVTLSDDGRTAAIGGPDDDIASGRAPVGAEWIFTTSGAEWGQDGPKLVPSNEVGQIGNFGSAASLSADGTELLASSASDDNGHGAAWIFGRGGGGWVQGEKLTASDETGEAALGSGAALSKDGTTAVLGGPDDSNSIGAVWVFPIDKTPPESFDLAKPADGAQNQAPRPTFSWDQATDADTGVDHYELWIDGSFIETVPPSVCNSGICAASPAMSLAQGAHTWQVKAVDGDINIRASSVQSFTVDATAPTAFTNLAPANGARFDDRAPTLQWSPSFDAGAGLAGYRVVIDGVLRGPDLPATSRSFTPVIPLTDGTHTWRVMAVDAAGNVENGPTSSFIVDTAPPHAVISANTTDTLTGIAVSFDASRSTDPEGAALTEYKWDPKGSGQYQSTHATPAFTHTYTTPGTYKALVRVTNQVGLTSTASLTIIVHAAPPPGPVGVSIDDAAVYTNHREVELTVVWPPFADTIEVSNDGGFRHARTIPVTGAVRRLAAPRTPVYVIPWKLRSGDSQRFPRMVYVRFGVSSQTYTDDIILDTIAPHITSAEVKPAHTGTPTPSGSSSWRVHVRARDENSGLAKMQITTRRSAPGPRRPYSRTATFRHKAAPRWIRVIDRAGNVSRWHHITEPGHLYHLRFSTATFHRAAFAPLTMRGGTSDGAVISYGLIISAAERFNLRRFARRPRRQGPRLAQHHVPRTSHTLRTLDHVPTASLKTAAERQLERLHPDITRPRDAAVGSIENQPRGRRDRNRRGPVAAGGTTSSTTRPGDPCAA